LGFDVTYKLSLPHLVLYILCSWIYLLVIWFAFIDLMTWSLIILHQH